jgi:ABC-type multidrug transport system ATPase subunit
MNETILRALMRLFAIIANVEEGKVRDSTRNVVVSYLSLMLNKEGVTQFINLFEEYVAVHHKLGKQDSIQQKKRTSVNSVKVLMICNEINEELHQEEKVIVLARLFEFISEDGKITDEELEFISTVADVFNIDEIEYDLLKNLIIGSIADVKSKQNILVVDKNGETNDGFRHIQSTHLDGQINFVYIKSTNTFILRYEGIDSLFLNGQNLIPFRVYVFSSGSLIKSSKIQPIYHSDISGNFIHSFSDTQIILKAENIRFKYNNSENGIHEFDFTETSGRLIGIMGGSGVGKSTFVNILNGTFPLHSGKITINGYDIQKDKKILEGVLGFVPQDDLLIEELSVYQNLYFNAKLCFKNFSESNIKQIVDQVLSDLDLFEVRNLKVGSPLNKFISGGQRKRLNIALELIREPSILIVDEPTSGLSSMDSEIVMSLMKKQTLKGKLVVINIHQPSSDIFKLFDSLLILDKGGFPIYYGNPVDSISYFKKAANYVNADESECPQCGNVNSEQVLEIIESKVVDEYGKFTKERKVAPNEWYTSFKEKIQIETKIEENPKQTQLPEKYFKTPSGFEQFKIFTKRNILSKLSNIQYLLVTFLEAPILAVILGYFTKYISGIPGNPDKYVFAENMNLPAYLFMAVTVALFFGMTISAEEIIKDRKILKREKFLNLSKFSYLNSKIIVLFIISAIQIFSFVLVGNYILGIEGMNLTYWLILFSTAAFANILGLNISSSFNSVVTIYITIPFILVPQLLFSGVIVDFTKLHKDFTSYKYVPVIGDIMTSRWAYEALSVAQFKNNEYEKYFFENDLKKSINTYKLSFLIPEIENKMNSIISKSKNIKPETEYNIIRNTISKLNKTEPVKFEFTDNLYQNKFNKKTEDAFFKYIEKSKQLYNNIQYKLNLRSDSIFYFLVEKYKSKENVVLLQQNFYNKNLSDILQNKSQFSSMKDVNGEIIQITDPIFKIPESTNGRAHFYSPVKKIGNITLSTEIFNVIFIWLTSLFLYLVLIFDLISKTANLFKKEKQND